VCLHDLTLERTTDVAKVFAGRFRKEPGGTRRWYVSDFTLAEIKRLDAGAWFGEKFRGTRIPAWQEALEEIRGKAGLYPETKAPEVYGSRGFDTERLVVDHLRKNELAEPGADPRTPVIIQSFSAASLRKMTDELECKLPKILLMGFAPKELEEIERFAVGIGPEKNIVRAEMAYYLFTLGVEALFTNNPDQFPRGAR